MGELFIPCEAGDVSDGYHTFDDLYEHRNHLFAALMVSHPEVAWRANNHHNGTNINGWFIAGIDLPSGTITYHLPSHMWTLLDGHGIATSNKAPAFDGHTSNDVIYRLRSALNADV